jgi:hypothetical protein
MPDFNPEPNTEQPSPKKPRRKPTKRKAKIAAVPKPARRKRRRVLTPLKQKPKEEVLLSPEVYKTIRILVGLNASERSLVLAIVQGLTK